jgi:hypothetical protein
MKQVRPPRTSMKRMSGLSLIVHHAVRFSG